MYKKIKKIFVREIITALQANNYRVNLIVVHVCESIRVVGVCVCVCSVDVPFSFVMKTRCVLYLNEKCAVEAKHLPDGLLEAKREFCHYLSNSFNTAIVTKLWENSWAAIVVFGLFRWQDATPFRSCRTRILFVCVV